MGLMDWLARELADHWLSCLLLALALALGAVSAGSRGRRGTWSLQLLLMASGLAILALGSFAIPSAWAWWLTSIPLSVLLAMLVIVLLTGRWSALLAWSLV